MVTFCLFVCLFGFLTSSSTTRLYRGRAPRQERLTILRAATHETELGDHDFCLSRSHYTDTDPTCRERAATAGIEPGTSSPGVARSTAELPRIPLMVTNSEDNQSQPCQWFNRDLSMIQESIRLHSSKNLADITELTQDKQWWRVSASRIEKAAEVSD